MVDVRVIAANLGYKAMLKAVAKVPVPAAAPVPAGQFPPLQGSARLWGTIADDLSVSANQGPGSGHGLVGHDHAGGAGAGRLDYRQHLLLMRSHFNTQADFGTIMLPTVVQGVAMAFFFIPLSVIVLSGTSSDKIPAASGLSSFVRIVAGLFGTSIATTVWQDRAAMPHAQLVESVKGSFAARQVLSGFGSVGLTPEQASAGIFLPLIPEVWLSRPKRASAGSADAATGAH